MVSLPPTHSKLFKKLILIKIRSWAEGNYVVPEVQSDFRSGGLLSTRVLPCYQEIKKEFSSYAPTLAIYVNYKKAYDGIWRRTLLVKLRDLEMPIALMKTITSWLEKCQAYITCGEIRSDTFEINIGLLQGSSLSPYLFMVYHCDLIKCIGAHSDHLFADDLSVLIGAPMMRSFSQMIGYVEKEGTQAGHNLLDYEKKNRSNLLIYKKNSRIAVLYTNRIAKIGTLHGTTSSRYCEHL